MVIVQIGSSMEEAEFTQRVVPCVSKLFASTDRSIRRSLLENIDAYGKQLSQVRLHITAACKVHQLKWYVCVCVRAFVRTCVHVCNNSRSLVDQRMLLQPFQAVGTNYGSRHS